MQQEPSNPSSFESGRLMLRDDSFSCEENRSEAPGMVERLAVMTPPHCAANNPCPPSTIWSPFPQPGFYLSPPSSDSHLTGTDKRSNTTWIPEATHSNLNCTNPSKMGSNDALTCFPPMSPPTTMTTRERHRCATDGTGDGSDGASMMDQWRAQSIMERRRTRRESHNAVERRRRNTINDNIQRLGRLLPENMIQGKMNKGTILKNSVDYIQMLQSQLRQYRERLHMLERESTGLSMFASPAAAPPFVASYVAGQAPYQPPHCED